VSVDEERDIEQWEELIHLDGRPAVVEELRGTGAPYLLLVLSRTTDPEAARTVMICDTW